MAIIAQTSVRMPLKIMDDHPRDCKTAADATKFRSQHRGYTEIIPQRQINAKPPCTRRTGEKVLPSKAGVAGWKFKTFSFSLCQLIKNMNSSHLVPSNFHQARVEGEKLFPITSSPPTRRTWFQLQFVIQIAWIMHVEGVRINHNGDRRW